MSITKRNAFMLTTGKISVVSRIFSNTIRLNCAKSGKQALSLPNIKRGAPCKVTVQRAMAGKNKYFILLFIKHSHVLTC